MNDFDGLQDKQEGKKLPSFADQIEAARTKIISELCIPLAGSTERPANTAAVENYEGEHNQKPDQKANSVKKGDDSFTIEYDNQGRLSRVTQVLGGRSEVLEPGKNFDDARLTADGTLILSKDGKVQEARTLEGGHREFKYNGSGQLSQIVDRIHTNSGRDLVETTTRLGESNVWDYKSNFGASGQRTNLVADAAGVYSADIIKRSHANDLIDRDNSDEFHRDLVLARQHLVEVASNRGISKFAEEWSKKFEQRCRDQAHRGIRSASDEQIARTYDYLEKILSQPGKITANQSKLLFQSALKEYAEPNKFVNQGGHPSCAFAMTERHVVQTYPDEHARVLYEAITNQTVRSKDGKKVCRLSDSQIKPDRESLNAARDGNTLVGEWSYSNKIFQLTAISVGYGGYRGNGYDMYGGTDDQCKRANRFFDGEDNMVILQNGNLSTYDKVSAYLKKHGTIGLFDYIGGHAMAITDAKTEQGKKYIYISNWWNGQNQGWKQV
jgi:hypothetical protein